eukprot:m.10908 g.10908  ORF g.10908 m.10908 type:complete len:933 (+) comp22777_c0_seq2:260-3058(+)
MLLSLAVLLTALLGHSQCRVVLQDNGYRNLVVAIGENVPESAGLLQEITTAFTKASSYLYAATKQRAYFHQVTILVPESWQSKSTYSTPTNGETFGNAEIRIDLPAVSGDNTAYVLSRGLVCGMEGEYMHVTPERLTEERYKLASPPYKMLIHEWGHLRWGVFDEYGLGQDAAYLSSIGKTEGTGCSVEIVEEGEVLDGNGKPCSAFNLAPTCRLRTKPNAKTRASVMFRQYIDSVDLFCDDSDDASVKHNFEAPNRQNRFCSHRSTWDVITSHGDFKNDANPPGPAQRNTDPMFKIVRKGEHFEDFIFLLDLSLSMASGDKMERLRQAAHFYIATATQGTRIGIVTVQTQGAIRMTLRPVWNVTDRQILSKTLPTKDEAAGDTSIGAGLVRCIELLTGKSNVDTLALSDVPSVGGTVIAITDGEENQRPLISDVRSLVEASGATVHTIALGQSASERLGVLSEDTQGMTFYAEESGLEANTQMLNEALMTVADQSSQSVSNPLMQVVSDAHVLQPSQQITETFMIDADIGHTTVLMVMWNATVRREKSIQVKLLTPTGTVSVDSTSPGYSLDEAFNSVQISLPSMPESGWWSYELYNPSNSIQHVTVSASSRRSTTITSGDNPITIASFISSMAVQYPQPVLITARVMKGYKAVTKATVIAEVARPDAPRWQLQLKDNGIAPDLTPNDGIYSAYFTEYSANGRYNVIIRASSGGTATLVNVMHQDDVAVMSDDELTVAGLPTVVTQREPLPPQPLSPFTRVRAAGAFQLDGFDVQTDTMAPGQVMDLEVVTTNLMMGSVELQWSAPGNDAYTGKVASYNVKISRNFTHLLRTFDSVDSVSSSDVLAGSLVPLSAGEQQRVTVKVDDSAMHMPYYVAISSTDRAGNPSQASNTVQFMLMDSPPTPTPTSGAPATLAGHFSAILLLLLFALNY